MDKETKKSRPAKRRRARTSEGKFIGDNPNTPDVNEAWEPTEVSQALPKKSKYQIKPKVNTSNKTAGKYSKKPTVRPTFGKVTTTQH